MRLETTVRNLALAGTAALGIGLGSANAAELEFGYKAGGWPVPSMVGARHVGGKRKDLITGIPGKETVLDIYKAADGTYFNVLSIYGREGKSRVYGYYVDTDGKPPMEYTLLDVNGNGRFESKVPHKGWGKTAPWVLEYVKGYASKE